MMWVLKVHISSKRGREFTIHEFPENSKDLFKWPITFQYLASEHVDKIEIVEVKTSDEST